MADKDSLINKFQRAPYPPLTPPVQESPALPELVKKKKEYRGAVESNRSNRSRRFRIVTAAGKSYLCGYAYLIETIRESETMMTLVTSTRLYSLTGTNLSEVERLLMEEKLRELHEFTGDIYEPAAPGKAAVISSIDITEAV